MMSVKPLPEPRVDFEGSFKLLASEDFLMCMKISLLVLLIGLTATNASHGDETGQLVGQLAGTDQQITYVGEVVVFLCDAKTGSPIHRETRTPFQLQRQGIQFDKLWFAITDEAGSFEFKNVPAGQYRLVAQSWSGTKGLPKLFGKTSAFVVLHGVAENVVVKQGERTVVFPRQLGNGVLRIQNDPAEAHAFLLISLKPTLGDAILGPQLWGDEFVSQIIGVTHMEQPHVTICGLPDNCDVHVALFNYDNNPGVGAGSFKAGARNETLRIVATWSNGHREPPPELKALTDHLDAKKAKFSDFLDEAQKGKNDQETEQNLIQELREHPRREVDVPGLGKRRLADVVAALSYIRLRTQHKK